MPEKKHPGITWNPARKKWLVTVEIGGGSRARRLRAKAYFPAFDADGKETTITAMKRWQEQTKTTLRLQLDEATEQEPDPATDGPVTLQDAADLYEPTITVKHKRSRVSCLNSWLKLPSPHGRLGDAPLAEALADQALKVIWSQWVRKLADSTLNQRRCALVACVTHAAPDFVAQVTTALPYRVQQLGVPRELPYPVIHRILDAMPPTSPSAFMRVLAETGLAPEMLRNLRPHDVDEDALRMTLAPREKGSGARAVTLPIVPLAAAAFRAYRAHGWHPASPSTVCRVWHRACEAVRTGAYVPCRTRLANGKPLGPPLAIADCEPYVLRHSFAGRFLDASNGDLHALKELMQHENIETTLRYVRARAARSVSAGIDALARIHPQIPPKDPTQA
jgi:integrase